VPRCRFGIFEFDPDTLEVRREGVPVRLQAQPARVLRLLLDKSGELVTREELRAAVWDDGTFVDFERGLNFCIAQIRSALQDSADSPRFVRTIPKRGYQFIAPVERSGVPVGVHHRPRMIAAAVAVIVTAFAVGAWYQWHAARTIRIAVARFDNESGDAGLDRFSDGLTDSVVAELTAAGVGRYGVIGNAAILRQPRPQRDLRAIGSSLDARFVILGQVLRGPSNIRVLAHLIRLPEQTHLTVARIDSAAVDPLKVQAEVAQRIVEQFSKRLTSSGK
jgi:DNA-binding winged helix-turn-helix (wHTH) protein/TolB-like protein